MKTTLFLSLEEVLALHDKTIKVHGGRQGVRDMGLLESAVLRCQSGYYNSLSEQAASLMQSLCMNHCFLDNNKDSNKDSNKRVALLATVVFLKMNGFNLMCSNSEVVTFIIEKVIKEGYDLHQISKWIASKVYQKVPTKRCLVEFGG